MPIHLLQTQFKPLKTRVKTKMALPKCSNTISIPYQFTELFASKWCSFDDPSLSIQIGGN